MKNVKRFIAAIILIGIAASPVSASHSTPWVTLYENSDTTGAQLHVAFKQSNLWTVRAGWGGCGYIATQMGEWDNCASALRTTLQSNRCLVLYDNANYSGATYAIHGPKSNQYFNLASVFNDDTTSLRFGTISGGVCTLPWS